MSRASKFMENLDLKEGRSSLKAKMRETLHGAGSRDIRHVAEVLKETGDKIMQQDDFEFPTPSTEADMELMKKAMENIETAANLMKKVKENQAEISPDEEEPEMEGKRRKKK